MMPTHVHTGHRRVHCLPESRLGKSSLGDRSEGEECKALHIRSPQTGRTWTTRIMPIAMWRKRWQWNGQSPGIAVTS